MKGKFPNFCCSVWWRPMLQDTALRLDQEKSSFWSLDYDVLKDLMEDYPLPNMLMLVRFAFQFWFLVICSKIEWMENYACQGIPCSFEIPYCVAIRFYCCHENKSFRSQVSKAFSPCTQAETSEKEPCVCHNTSPRFNQVWHWGKSCWMEK